MVRLHLNDRTRDMLHRLYPYAVGAAAMTFPLSPRIYTPVMVVACLLWLLMLSRNLSTFRNDLLRRTFFSIVAIYAVQLVGLLYTSEWTEAMKELETKSSMIAIPAIVLFSNLNARQIKRIFWMFTLAILAICVFLLFYSIRRAIEEGDPLRQVILGNLYQTTYFTTPLEIHPTYLSLFACLSIFFLVDSMRKERMLQAVLMMTAALFLMLINCILLSRGALIGFVLAGLAYIVHRYIFRERKPRIVVAAILGLTVIIITAFIYIPNFRHKFTDQASNLQQYWQGYYPDSSTSLHLHSWKCSFLLIKEKPVLGYGTGDEVGRLMDCYKEHNMTKSLENKYNAHNEFLSGMIRHGILGLAVLMYFFGYTATQALRQHDSLLLAVLILFLSVSLFESTLNVYRGVVFLSLFVSLLIKRCAVASTTSFA